ncbi:MAG: UDP-N-acetylmuramate dehydrogenase [Terracidiphilus sp.]|jgi:UDP-N-acetylmuramate dehydrogenase
MKMEENKPLAPYTTFGIGGPAQWFCEAASEDEIVEATGWARERGLPLFVLGGGSNLLVADRGFDGLVLRIALLGIEPHADGPPGDAFGEWVYRVAAGEDWDRFVTRAVKDNCAGIECLAGIPGTVGGTPVQNVGAYGQEVASAIERVRVFDLETRVFVEFSVAECGFSYRCSRFNSNDRGRYIVTRVDYRLHLGGAPTLRYADLQRFFEQSGNEPSLAEVAAVVRRVRQAKGMLLVEGDPDCRSAGSFFKNPVVSEELAGRIAAVSEKEMPRFPAGPGQVKVPAAWLIEQAGFAKGYAAGAAGVSSRHTLALVNRGGASAAEILALAEEIVAAVDARFGIRLEREPVLVGF